MQIEDIKRLRRIGFDAKQTQTRLPSNDADSNGEVAAKGKEPETISIYGQSYCVHGSSSGLRGISKAGTQPAD